MPKYAQSTYHMALDCDSNTECTFTDFSKAFHGIRHVDLCHKWHMPNCDNSIIAWAQSFLTNRHQYVLANSCTSSLVLVLPGPPQGLVLGLFFFLIYIDDLVCLILCFVHLCILCHEIIKPSDCMHLPSSLHKLLAWCFAWQMGLNLPRCKHPKVSRNNNKCSMYVTGNTALERVTPYKYLGVHISCNHHSEYIADNTTHALGCIQHKFRLASPHAKLTLCRILVLPKLERAASAWDSGQQSLVYELELCCMIHF